MLLALVVFLLLSTTTTARALSDEEIMTSRAALPGALRRIAKEHLFVSTPNPSWFGNSPNPKTRDPNWSAENWLTSRFHFAFAEHSSGRPAYGPLRVLNDDVVQPSRGFGTHPHSNMEIVTFIVRGELSHQDSMGTRETLSRGAIQFMTAGTGVRHSEHNLHETEPLEFLQIWINPRKRGLEPNYGSYQPSDEKRPVSLNEWSQLVSDVQDSAVRTPVEINQDLDLHVVELEPGKEVSFDVREDRQVYLVQIEGSSDVASSHDGVTTAEFTLAARDAADGPGPMKLNFKARDGVNSLILLMHMTRDA